MNQKQCFEPGCENEVEYACKCTSPESFFCKPHIERHIKKKIAGRNHLFDSIFTELNEDTKQAILRFLMKEYSKYSKLKKSIIDSFNRRLFNLEKDLKECIQNLDIYSVNIENAILRTCEAKKVLKSDQNSFLELLTLQPDEAVKKVKSMISDWNDWYKGAKLFYIYNENLENLIESFLKLRFQAYLDIMHSCKESNIETNNGIRNSAGVNSASIKNSISLKEIQNLIRIKAKNESETMLLNSNINSITSDLNSKLEKIESPLNLIVNTLTQKTAELLSTPNNRELEMDFRAICSAYQENSSLYDPLLAQACQDYLNTYQQKTSLYNFTNSLNGTEFWIFNTETGTKELEILETPKPLGISTCITQLPNGKLFCFGNWPVSGITVLVDVNRRVKVLPPGTPCGHSSCIYFNNTVYCFGGMNGDYLALSSKFDLGKNRWIQLTPMPKADSGCNSIIFNGNILIAGMNNTNLLRYSIDRNSFTTIPFKFAEEKRKILINEERLYLIECRGSVYESEIGSDMKWKRIADSRINCDADQVYCSYNKGGIYIGVCYWDFNSNNDYYKFDLNEKRLIKLE